MGEQQVGQGGQQPTPGEGNRMDKSGRGPSSGGRSFQDTDFQRKLEAARARRMKVLAERGETMPVSRPATGAAVTPTVMRNLKKAIGQLPVDGESDPDPEPAGGALLLTPIPATVATPPLAASAPEPAPKPAPTPTHTPVPFPAKAEATLAPAPLRPPMQVAQQAQPALSFSFVAVLIAAAGIGLTFDKTALEQMGSEASAAFAAFIDLPQDAAAAPDASAAAPQQAEPTQELITLTPLDPRPVVALTQAPEVAQVSRAAISVASPGVQNDATQSWAIPSERGMVQMPPLTGRVDLAPQTPYETASAGPIGALTSVQETVGAFDQNNTSVTVDTALPVLKAPTSATRTIAAAPKAMANPDPTSGTSLTQIALAALSPADPALELASLLQPAPLEPPVLVDTEIEQLTTPNLTTGPRPQARPVLLAASRTPLARPQIDVTVPPAQLVELAEGQSGKTADRPLFVHIPGQEDAALFDEVLDTVRAQITPHAQARPVPFKVSNPQVRFYHEQDRETATAMAEVLEVRLHDLTNFRPTPKRGLIEVWVQGTDVSPVSVAATPRRQARRTPQRNRQVRRQPAAQPAPAPVIEPTLPASALEPAAIGSAVEAALQQAAPAATPEQPAPGTVTATVRQVQQGTATTQEGVRVRRVQVAPEASRSPVRRLFNSWGSQNVTTIEQFRRENSD